MTTATKNKPTEAQRSRDAARTVELIVNWQSQIEREGEEYARRIGASALEIVAYAEGCRRGAQAMIQTLKVQGLF
jgi:hypothetical protein